MTKSQKNKKKKTVEQVNVQKTEVKKKKIRLKKFHISFGKRLSFYAIFFIISIFGGIYFIINSMKVEHKENLIFNEHGNVSYSVCLNNNDFFEDNCLNSNMSYVASLIKNIPLSFSYRFKSNKNGVIQNIDYEIVAKLVISNSESSAKYYEKEYVLLDKTHDEIKNTEKEYFLNKKIDIDYEYYNEIANKFKSEYGVDAQSYLQVYLITDSSVNSTYDLPTSGRISVQIPLSQRAIEIKLDTQGINKIQDQVITTKYFNIVNWVRLICGILLILFSFYYLISIFGLLLPLRKKNTKYAKFLSNIMKEYDRLIVETVTLPKFDNYNILKIKSFNELLDVRDNLRLPIMFYEVSEHEKAHFYILHDKNLYLYTLKEVDLQKNGRR